jgi:hypothetical protein
MRVAQRPRLLLIATDYGHNAATMRDHIAALQRFSSFDVRVVNNYFPRLRGVYPRATSLPSRIDLDAFDAVVVHYTCEFSNPTSFDSGSWERLKSFRGLKALFVQDEYQQVDRTVRRMREVGIDVLFTCVPESEWQKVYSEERLPGLRRVQTLTGFVPEHLLTKKYPAIRNRPIDVGYRARELPYWLGQLAQEKTEIAHRFSKETIRSGLKLDVSAKEEDRLYGQDWIRFLGSCKALLGVESGASVFDFSGELSRTIRDYCMAHPSATFAEVQRLFLLPHENRIRLNQISPRCFESAATRTAMVLYEGEYSGILQPNRHYVPLRKDFSNLEEVVRAVKDTALLQDLADRAYAEIAINPAYSFATFAGQFDRVMKEEIERRRTCAGNRAGRRMFATSSPGLALVNAGLTGWLRLPAGARRVIKRLIRRG